MNDQELKALLDTIETPPMDLTGPVLESLHKRKAKHRFSRLRFLAAALVGAAVLLGARQFYEYVMIGGDGSIEEAQVAASYEVAIDEETETSNEPYFWPESKSPREFYLNLTSDGGMGIEPPDIQRQTVAQLWEYVANARVKLPFPMQLPQGYEGGGDAIFYFSPEMAGTPQQEWIEGGAGYYFQKFLLPEEILNNVSDYRLFLLDGQRTIDISVEMTQDEDKLFASGKASTEKVRLGAWQGIYVEEPPDEFSPQGEQKVFFTGKIPKTAYIYGFALGAEEREKRGFIENSPEKAKYYRYFACTISGEGVEKETLLEIAKNMTFPEAGMEPPAIPSVTDEKDQNGIGFQEYYF